MVDRVTLSSNLPAVIGTRTATQLREKLELITVEDLLRYYPRKYERVGQMTDLAAVKIGDRVTVQAKIKSVTNRKPKAGSKVKSITTYVIGEGRLELSCTFFNRQYLTKTLKPGSEAMFSGTVSMFNKTLQMTSPQVGRVHDDNVDGTDQQQAAKEALDIFESFPGGLIPVYPLTDGVTSQVLQKSVRAVLEVLETVADPLPPDLLSARNLSGLMDALSDIHRPRSAEALKAAQARLRYDEALAVQLVLARRRAVTRQFPAPTCPPVAEGLLSAFDKVLPFELTAGQREVGLGIEADLAGGYPMNRLLQGEVGSGKTVVALRAMLQVIDSGYQAVLLAPTEVLAAQHARSLRAILGPLGGGGELGSAEQSVAITLLTGSLNTAARRKALLDIASGQAGIAVGTHALLSEGVFFAGLGLIVIDEQHRFGVEQRDTLRSRRPEDTPPHVLVMTATPIPRTVAMTVFGDLDTSTLKQLPAGRSPISTTVVPVAERPAWLDRAWQRVREEVAKGHQAYVVCPKIGDEEFQGRGTTGDDGEPEFEDDGPPAKRPPIAVLDLFAELSGNQLSGLRLGVLHGRLPPAEKDATMSAFAAGQIDVLVATTVIEVGVDVANATVMMIMDAERFGMSQLHQLRGRVGRGSAPGVCLLITETHPASPGMTRLKAVEEIADGFRLAEADLGLRREGDVLGTSQAGRSTSLRQLSLLRDQSVIEDARKDAAQLVGDDPEMTAWPGLADMVAAVVAQENQEYLEKA